MFPFFLFSFRKEVQNRCSLFFLKRNADLYSEITSSILSFLPVHRRDEGKGMGEGREPSEEFFFVEIVSCTFNYLMAGNDYSGLS